MLTDSLEFLTKETFINPTFAYDLNNLEPGISEDDLGATRKYVKDLVKNSATYDIATFMAGETVSDSVILMFVSPRNLVVKRDFSPNARAKIAPSSTSTFSIKKNNNEVGEIVFFSGQVVGNINLIQDISLQKGDLLEIISPNFSDSSLADVAITLVAFLV